MVTALDRHNHCGVCAAQKVIDSTLAHKRGCQWWVTDLDTYPEGDVFCRRCGRVLGTDWLTIHRQHQETQQTRRHRQP